jgi:hypothetical protein
VLVIVARGYLKMQFEYLWTMPNQWTFEIKEVQTILYSIVNKHKRILIPFAGQFRFPQTLTPKYYTYIDIDSTRPKPCIYGDCLEVMAQRLEGQYDLIISDPPFCFYQAIHTYNNKKMQDISKCKDLYDQLLISKGQILHFGFNTTGMGQKRGYMKEKIWVLNHGGSHNDTLILLETKN